MNQDEREKNQQYQMNRLHEIIENNFDVSSKVIDFTLDYLEIDASLYKSTTMDQDGKQVSYLNDKTLNDNVAAFLSFVSLADCETTKATSAKKFLKSLDKWKRANG